MGKSRKVGRGTRIQSGLAMRRVGDIDPLDAQGALMAGVVLATYVSDSDGHPMAGNDRSVPSAVYCDVLVYAGVRGRWMGLKNVLVAQPTGGMHRGRIWKPRAATVDISGNELNSTSNPADLDGDHVLIGFIGNSLDRPVILRGLPHPARDAGAPEDAALGRRTKLTVADGDPDLIKHHGAFYGVDGAGNWTVDTSRANNGELADTGAEPAPPTDGSGAQTHVLPQDALHEVIFYDMGAEPPNEVMRITNSKDGVVVKVAQGATLELTEKDANAALKLGDGAVHAAIFEQLQSWWDTVVLPKLNTFDTHVHANPSTYIAPLIPAPGPPVPVVPVTVPPAPVLAAPSLAAAVKSTKISMPDG